ncbi:MAG: polysaccharide deacetylase family protein [Terracidiphilus sp.]
MASNTSYNGKHEWLLQTFHRSGASFVSSKLPARDSLLVLNYHRIGNPEEDLFDPGVFSATAEEFDTQISFLKKNVSLVTLEEALAFVDGTQKEKGRHCRVLITFDDGYLDNYEIAHPILRSHGAQGVFFLVTSMVGSHHVPWWDHISYLMKTGRKRRYRLRYPGELEVDIDQDGMEQSLRAVLKLYKRPENTDPERFIREVAEETQGDGLPATLRRFLNWDEAREMRKGGAAIGSHTHSHHVLSQLEPDRQFEELSKSRAILTEQLGAAVDTIAYPVGNSKSFTEDTKRIAREVGYRAAFSFYGGANFAGKISAYDVGRFDIEHYNLGRLRLETAMWRLTGHIRWP